jgi:hypothetical protein
VKSARGSFALLSFGRLDGVRDRTGRDDGVCGEIDGHVSARTLQKHAAAPLRGGGHGEGNRSGHAPRPRVPVRLARSLGFRMLLVCGWRKQGVWLVATYESYSYGLRGDFTILR